MFVPDALEKLREQIVGIRVPYAVPVTIRPYQVQGDLRRLSVGHVDGIPEEIDEYLIWGILLRMIKKESGAPRQDLAGMLRVEIRKSGLSWNAVSELAGVRYGPLWRFMSDDSVDLRLETASKLLAALNLRVEFRSIKRSKNPRK